MNLRLLLLAGLPLLAACTKEPAPVRLYFVASSRFTAGSRSALQPADTLAVRLFAAGDSANGTPLSRLHITTTYLPTRQPFAYPSPITAFIYSNVPTNQPLVYLDSALAVPNLDKLLYTTTFGIRTTTGAERWEFTVTNSQGSTSARSFYLTQRRTDSLSEYHDYLLRLNVPARGVSARRFIQLKAGLALPAYTVVGTSTNPTPDQQALTDLIQSADGLQLFSPDSAGLNAARWPSGNRRRTRFYRTNLDATGFANAADTTGIRQQFVYPGRGILRGLAVNQVYAFRTYAPTGAADDRTFGLLRVVNVPGGTTAGLQLQVRLAKRPL